MPRRALRVWEHFLARIPVVKTVYGAVRDMTRLLPSGDAGRDLQSVVLWRAGGAYVLGFVTREELTEFGPGVAAAESRCTCPATR